MRDLRALPKAHLHLHLEGAMRPSTLRELASGHGMAEPAVSGFTSFTQFLELYDAACAVLHTPDDLRRLVREVAEDAAADGAVWVEVHSNPALHRERLGEDEDVLALVLAACAEATEATGVGMGVVMSANRAADPAEAVRLAHLAAGRAGNGVVAMGLANDETGYPPEPFADAFAIAREAGLLSTPHAGEGEGPPSVRGALDALRPDRVAHGVRAVEDPALVARLAHEGVCLDVCPSSNLTLGLYPSMAEHPLPALLAAGVPVTLNADDPLLFGPGLGDEYELVRRELTLDDDALAAIARTSIVRSGARAALKEAALSGVDVWLAGSG